MKARFTVLLLLIGFLCHSQAGTAIYKKEVSIPEDLFEDLKQTDPRRYKNFMGMNKKIVEAAKQLEFELRFAQGEAVFEPQEIMSTESIDASLGLGPHDGIHYTNRNTGEHLWQTEAYFGMVLLITWQEPEWELHEDTKVISGYRAKKAIGKLKMRKGKEERTRTIEAWYAPDIPVSFGPRGFSGLPGLILELTENRERYYLTKVTMDPEEEINIEKPRKGKKITYEELKEMTRKAMENMKPQ